MSPDKRHAAGGHSRLRQIAQRVAQGDPQAFASAHDSLMPGLRAVFLRRSGQRFDIADDLAQQTWAAVWDAIRRGRYDPERAAFSTFVYAVANNIWLRFCRAQRRGCASALVATADPAPEPERLLAYCELLEAVRACLRGERGANALSAEEREIVFAAARGTSERRLAERLGVAASTINARKKAAYDKIRRCLAFKGFSAESVEQLDLLDE